MNLYDGIKDIAKIVQKADNIELFQKVLDLQKEALDLIDENRMLKEKIKEFEYNKKIEESLIFLNNCYYLKSEKEELIGPYCSTCWDKDKKLIRMTEEHGFSSKSYRCNACNYFTQFDSEVYKRVQSNNGITII